MSMDEEPAVNSKEWLAKLLREKCGYKELHDYQLQHGLDLINGRDLVLVVRPGGGKTTIMLAPLLAAQARGEDGIALIVVPTKLLSEQLAGVASTRGLHALAINEDTVRDTDLFKDLATNGGIRVGVMSPQMLRGQRMSRFLASVEQKEAVRWMMVDEAHLTCEDSGGWRTAYTEIKFMRARLFSRTVWAAFTGTSTPQEALRMARHLGFKPGHYINARYSVDIPSIKYITRFMAYPHSGDQFFDLAFLIPQHMTSPDDIPRTFVFCDTIEMGSRIMTFLDNLIPPSVPRRGEVIKSYNSLMPVDYRQHFIRDITDGTTLRIGVCTDTCTYGLDVPCIRRVVIYGLCDDFNTEKQRLCRAGRDGLPAVAYSIVPEWVRELPEEEVTTAQAKENAARRVKLSDVVRQWHNPTRDLCPRAIDCRHNEQDLDAASRLQPISCCSLHDPEPEHSSDQKAIEHWVARTHTKNRNDLQKQPAPRSDGTHRALEPQMVKSLTRMLMEWRGATWTNLRGDTLNKTCEHFLSTTSLIRIAEKAHVCTTVQRLEQVIGVLGWKYLDQCGEDLVAFLAKVMEGFDAIFDARIATGEDDQSSDIVGEDWELNTMNVDSNDNPSQTQGISVTDVTNTVAREQGAPRLRLIFSAKRAVVHDEEMEMVAKRIKVEKENCTAAL
ncbi:P-loop containing nucleoside triphosphate hydrolase protein [Cytidiella melzeri]|nr:P-loop containing nucleoside triphosphate hydrolase protein [Cytidiella melzeri]